MSTISAYDAKTHLSEFLQRAHDGETFTITRHGQPVALLTPASGAETTKSVIDQLRALRSEMALGGLSARELVDEGRRW